MSMFYKNNIYFFRTSGEDKSVSLCFIKSGEDKIFMFYKNKNLFLEQVERIKVCLYVL